MNLQEHGLDELLELIETMDSILKLELRSQSLLSFSLNVYFIVLDYSIPRLKFCVKSSF